MKVAINSIEWWWTDDEYRSVASARKKSPLKLILNTQHKHKQEKRQYAGESISKRRVSEMAENIPTNPSDFYEAFSKIIIKPGNEQHGVHGDFAKFTLDHLHVSRGDSPFQVTYEDLDEQPYAIGK